MLGLLLLQNAPPDTTDGLILGYVVMGLIAAVYVVTLIVRRRSLKRDSDVLDQIEARDE